MYRYISLLLPLMMPLASWATPERCTEWFDRQQQSLERERIHDAGSTRMVGHPHLRVDRWLAFLHSQVYDDVAATQWLHLAGDLARRDWQAELMRLRGMDETWQRVLDHCIEVLVDGTDFTGLPAPRIADAYNSWQRALGLYPVTRWLATPSIRRYHRDMSARLQDRTPAPAMAFVPQVDPVAPPPPATLMDNPLRVPVPDRQARDKLLSHYAPILHIARIDEDNLPGQLRLNDGEPRVDPASPVAYYWLSWTRFAGENLLQLNYQFWFAQRPKDGLIDLYAGTLDSLIWRVTLNPDGSVLFYDSIHSCGCYHKVFPVDRRLQTAQMSGDQPVFMQQPGPDALETRIALSIEPDTHYLLGVHGDSRLAWPTELPRASYALLHADQLRRLPDPVRNGFDSLYNHRGLVPESRRPERWLLWPLGVPSAGAMRQPGQHATAFIGRRHFDDPRLAEEMFEQSGNL